MSTEQPLIEVKNLKTHFPVLRGLLRRRVGTIKAVDGVSLRVAPSETVALVGESGCGKTTTGRSILRLLEATSGEVLYKGKDLRHLDPHALRAERRHLQIIFQDPYSSLNPRMTVGEIIGAAWRLHNQGSKKESDALARFLLDRVGLQESYASRYPHEFSGGQRQRIGIARAIALQPEFIVCDEPVSALDVSVQAQIINLLMDLKHSLRLSYLFIAHDLSVVRHLSDRVAVMYLGRIVEEARTDELYSGARHPYTQALLGAVPRANPAERNRKRFVLSGDVPSPMQPPSGCHFHPRCPLADARCRNEVPATHRISETHKTTCHRYEGQTDLVPIHQKAL